MALRNLLKKLVRYAIFHQNIYLIVVVIRGHGTLAGKYDHDLHRLH